MPMREQVNVTLLLNYWELKHNARQILDFLRAINTCDKGMWDNTVWQYCLCT